MRQPVGGYPVKRTWIVDGINYTDDMGFSDFGFEACTILWTRYHDKVNGASVTRQEWVYRPPESTIYVVTFSGVTSGGIVTSGTTCWTYGGRKNELVKKRRHRVRTWATKDSLMREVTIVLFPTPSTRPLSHQYDEGWMNATHHHQLEEFGHPVAYPSLMAVLLPKRVLHVGFQVCRVVSGRKLAVGV
jgi:hypothetical protein